MLIEFDLPPSSAGLLVTVSLRALRREIETWANKHHIGYTEKTVKQTHRLCFADDEHYTLFMLSWHCWDMFAPRVVRERNKQ